MPTAAVHEAPTLRPGAPALVPPPARERVRMTRDEWFACTDPRVLLAYVREEYGARYGEDSDGTCRAPGCCGTPLPTCDEIREEWEAPDAPAPIAAPKPCDRCVSAYHAAAPSVGWCSECAPDGVLIGVLCACGCERLVDGQERCEECA